MEQIRNQINAGSLVGAGSGVIYSMATGANTVTAVVTGVFAVVGTVVATNFKHSYTNAGVPTGDKVEDFSRGLLAHDSGFSPLTARLIITIKDMFRRY